MSKAYETSSVSYDIQVEKSVCEYSPEVPCNVRKKG